MKIAESIKSFIKDSRSVGILLMGCTVVSIILSNAPAGNNYIAFWQRRIVIPGSIIHLPASAVHIVNDVLMSIFFFSAALEIKREILTGQLNTVKKSVMPLISAFGGMLFPALIYLLWCHDKNNFRGWGIPTATDIAFSLAVLSLLGKRVPLALRVFLTAIAIIDDIGGILTIAVFYTREINHWYILLATITTSILLILNFFKVTRIYIYVFIGVFLWYFIYNSGVHPTIAGVILAFTIPAARIFTLEHLLRLPVNLIILPLFAMANTAIQVPPDFLGMVSSRIHFAIFTGLLLGKPIGIFLFTYLAHKLKIATIPDNIALKQVLGMGMVAGIGFTVSIFIAMLAFHDEQSQLTAKLAVINASVCSGLTGYFYLLLTNKKHKKSEV